MSRPAADYAAQLRSLLPRGPIWNAEPTGNLAQLLLALADEFSRIDGRADALLEEADPRTTLKAIHPSSSGMTASRCLVCSRRSTGRVETMVSARR